MVEVSHKMTDLLSLDQTLLLVIDIQDKFRSVIFNADQVIENTRRLIQGCALLDVPVWVTEQYPQGLGETVAELKAVLPETAEIFEKTSFGACGDEIFLGRLQSSLHRQVMVCGLEAHVCVNQTVMCLLDLNYDIFLIEDAIGSRSETHYQIALKKLAYSGAVPSCVEMALFELLREARHPQFKAVQQLVR